MEKIRVLLIGCGRMGRNHLRVLREHPRFKVFGVVDTDRKLPGTFAHIPFSQQSEWDAAIVATPTATHDAIVRTLKCPVLVEKPISDRAQWDGRDFGVVVGHIERFNPAVRALRGVLGDLGTIQMIRTTRIGGEPPRDGRDIVLDLAVHDLDIVRWIFGRLRVEFSDCQKDEARIALRTQRGAVVNVEVDWKSATKRRELVAEGEDGIAIVDYVGQTLKVGAKTIPVEKCEPLRAELDAFADFVQTGARGDLCSTAAGVAAVRLCEIATSGEGFV